MLLTVLVLTGFAAAPLALVLARAGLAGAVTLLPVALFTAFASLLPGIIAGNVMTEQHAWVPSLGVMLSFRADGLSLLFALLITGIGSCVFLYAGTYLAGHPDRPKFFAYLSMFMGAMLGAVLADNLIVLLVFWELTSITSFLLIGFEHEKPQVRKAAQQGLLVTVGGSLALTTGIILLGHAAESFQIGELVTRVDSLLEHAAAPAIIVLIAWGALTKSAQTPFHFWLPNAMVAPTPVSAYLHSATMVKLGVYLLARLDPVFGEHKLWTILLVTAGSATMLTAAVLMLRETDLKRILAYSTLAALGTLMTLVGLSHPVAAAAMATFLLVHALYKACLFLVAGAIDHEAGTRDSSKLGGLARTMPMTAIVAMLGACSMAGLPPFMGFIGKELVYEADLGAAFPWLAAGIALVANAATVGAAGVIAIRCFWGPAVKTPLRPHDPPLAMLLGPALLALLGLIFGIDPRLVEGIVAKATETMTRHEAHSHLALWHGATRMLILSLATVAIGTILFAIWQPLRRMLASRSEIDRFGPSAAYDRCLAVFPQVAAWQTRLIQSGSLHTYLSVTFATMTVAVAATLVVSCGWGLPTLSSDMLRPIVVLPLLLVLAAFAVVRADSFMTGIVAAGMVGFLTALVYLFQGAPDLAFTQFSVEALSVVVILAIVGRMPMHDVDMRTKVQRRRDIAIAVGFGATATAVLLAVTAAPFDARLSRFYELASVAKAHGHNVVNVIIVDFRGLDTLGEITVLTLAAMAALALLIKSPTRRRKPLEKFTANSEGRHHLTGSLILRYVSRLLLPAAFAFSFYLLWRGHNEPGGGFVGGLIAAAGVTAYALPRGRSTITALLRIPPQSIAGLGVLLALSSAMPSLLARQAFMTHQWLHFESGFALGTPLAFDLGVYLVVLGAVLTFLSYYLES